MSTLPKFHFAVIRAWPPRYKMRMRETTPRSKGTASRSELRCRDACVAEESLGRSRAKHSYRVENVGDESPARLGDPRIGAQWRAEPWTLALRWSPRN